MSSFSPRRVVVKELVRSRYPRGVRPDSWDERCAGVDQIKGEDGDVFTLFSDGQQSPPQVGWTILLTSPFSGSYAAGFPAATGTVGEDGPVYRWTLYGM